jgi:hypothetical protein
MSLNFCAKNIRPLFHIFFIPWYFQCLEKKEILNFFQKGKKYELNEIIFVELAAPSFISFANVRKNSNLQY